MSEPSITKIRTALVRPVGGLGRPYPERARRAALDWAERRSREGMKVEDIADALGISATTLRGWSRHQRTTTPSAFCPVEIVDPGTAPRGAVVLGPGGLRIEGLSVAEIAELVRRLA